MKEEINLKMIGKLEKAAPPAKPFNVEDTSLKGFTLRVEPSGRMSFYCRYRVKGGRQSQKRIGVYPVVKPKQARDEAQEILGKARRGIDPVAEERVEKVETFGQFIEKEYAPKKLALQRSGDAALIRLKACFGPDSDCKLWPRRLDDPTVGNLIDNWQHERLKVRKRTTVVRDTANVRAVFSYAKRRGYIKAHPMANIERFGGAGENRVRYLDADEEKRLMAQLDAREERLRKERDHYNARLRERERDELPDLRAVRFADYLAVMVLVSMHTGVRRGEMFGLTWGDVDFIHGLLTVRATVAKSGKVRHIPLNQIALNALKAWRDQAPEEARSPERYVFVSPKTGGRFTATESSWDKILRDAKISNFHWHDLRHHFASRLVQSGVNLYIVKELLGHSSIGMTERYAHLAPTNLAAAVARLEQPAGNVVAFPSKAETA